MSHPSSQHLSIPILSYINMVSDGQTNKRWDTHMYTSIKSKSIILIYVHCTHTAYNQSISIIIFLIHKKWNKAG